MVTKQRQTNLGDCNTKGDKDKKRQGASDLFKRSEENKDIKEKRKQDEQGNAKRVRINEREEIVNETKED